MVNKRISRPVCLIGLGLIGGSLLRDLSAAQQPVFGYNHSTSGARAAAREGFDVSDDLPAVLTRAEEEGAIIVLAVPMNAVGPVLDQILEFAPTCGVTDVVSVKKPVYDAIHERGMSNRYVGGHPMAGTAESGWNASQEGLFKRAAYVITFSHAVECEETGEPVQKEWIDLFADVARMINLVGAEAVPVRVANHDAAVARISHLPHVLAETLSIVGDNGGILAQSLAAGSFRDGTRVAGTDPKLVQQMCGTNAPALLDALDEALTILQATRDKLASDTPDLTALAEAGHRAHTRIAARRGAHKNSVSPVKISSRPVLRLHPGGYGWLGTLKQAESLGGRIEIF